MLTLGSCAILLGLLTGIANTFPCRPNTVSTGNNGVCISVKECISRGFLVYGRRCVHSCPLGTFYLQETRTCYNQCPRHTILNGTECLNGTYCMSKNNQVLVNGTCQAKCPSSMAFKKYGTCYSMCPKDTVVNGSECLLREDCKKNNGFVNGSACVAQCPPENKYILKGVCHRSCPSSIAVKGNGTNCLYKETCTVKLGWVIFNSSCVATCPREAPYNDTSTCYKKCPTGKVALGKKCIFVEECKQKSMLVYQKACTANCPDVAPLHVDSHCYGQCPEGTVLYNGSCINELVCVSPFGHLMVIFNGTCVDICPQEAPFDNNGGCTNTCPKTTVVSDMQCVDINDCLDSNRYISNGTCVSTCPQASPYVLRSLCYHTCPGGSVISEPGQKLCIDELQCNKLNKKVYNNTCVATCPLQSPYIYAGHCYSVCPNKTVSLTSRFCILALSCKFQNKFVQETECVDSCSSTFPYTLDNTCYSECPSNSSLFPGNRCVTIMNCYSESNAVIYNGTCLPSCLRNVPYRHDGKCLSKCPLGMLINDHDCIYPRSCPPSVIYNGTCLPSCPQNVPYKHDGKCLSKCPLGMLINDHDCIYPRSCPPSVIYNGTCLLSCPQNVPYTQDGKCLSKCPKGMLIRGFACVSKFSCLKNKIYNGICMSACPTEAPYTAQMTLYKICHTECPQNTVLNGSSCVEEYMCILSNNYFIYNGSCVTECPPGSSTFVRGVCYDARVDQYTVKVLPALILVMFVLLFCLVHNPTNLKGKDITQVRPDNQKLLEADDDLNCAVLQTMLNQEQGTSSGPDQERECSEVMIAIEELSNANHTMAEGVVDAIVHHLNDEDDVPLLPDDDPLIQHEDIYRSHSTDDALLFGDGNNV
ncbi:proprotein convertase subtilisin/kexin type 5-like [Haliotis cracherodii]|uniref:proprotein convertase subtilisin/kexin type 5-like n=1 Tax=Haliotis cracherodii TaxID=6455 RepID=UPI0039EABEA2